MYSELVAGAIDLDDDGVIQQAPRSQLRKPIDTLKQVSALPTHIGMPSATKRGSCIVAVKAQILSYCFDRDTKTSRNLQDVLPFRFQLIHHDKLALQ